MNTFFLLMVSFLLWSCSESEDSAGVSGTQVGGVQGKVLNIDDEGQSNSEVILSRYVDGSIVQTSSSTADTQGKFAFGDLEAGLYQIAASTKEGLSGVIDSIQVNQGVSTQVTIIVNIIIIQNFNTENIGIKNEYHITQIVSPSQSLNLVDGQWILDTQKKDTIAVLVNNDTLFVEVTPNGKQYKYQVLESNKESKEQPKDTTTAILDTFDIKKNNGVFTDYRDKEEYPWTRIGDQIWMASNLRFNAKGSLCYELKLSNCLEHGRLYTWVQALNIDTAYVNTSYTTTQNPHKGICPQDWHIPTRQEWRTMANYIMNEYSISENQLENTYDVAIYLNSSSGWSVPGKDTYDFNAKPSGRYLNIGSFIEFGERSQWWTQEEQSLGGAHTTSIYNNNENLYLSLDVKFQSLSLRCIKD